MTVQEVLERFVSGATMRPKWLFMAFPVKLLTMPVNRPKW
jgi:hypothetical protein